MDTGQFFNKFDVFFWDFFLNYGEFHIANLPNSIGTHSNRGLCLIRVELAMIESISSWLKPINWRRLI